MDKLRQWVALTVVAALGIAAAGWFLVVSPKRVEAAELRDQASDQVAANDLLRNQVQVLKAKAKELPKEQARLAAVAAKIPDNPALPSLIRALTRAADGSGVTFLSLEPGAPSIVPSAADAATSGTAAATVTAGSAAAGASLSVIPLTISVLGDYFAVQNYLMSLEQLPRALRVDNLVIAPGADPLVPTGTAAATPTAQSDGKDLLTVITGSVFLSDELSGGAATAATRATDPSAAVAPAPSAPAN